MTQNSVERFFHLTGRNNKDHWPLGTGVSLELCAVGPWDLTALLTQWCQISILVMPVYTSTPVFPLARREFITLSYGVLLNICGLQVVCSSVRCQNSGH